MSPPRSATIPDIPLKCAQCGTVIGFKFSHTHPVIHCLGCYESAVLALLNEVDADLDKAMERVRELESR